MIDLCTWHSDTIPVVDEHTVHAINILKQEWAGTVMDDICVTQVEVGDQENIGRFGWDWQISFKSGLFPECRECIAPAGTIMTVICIDPAFPCKIIFRKDLLSMHNGDAEPGLIEQWW
jgi:hypothetical protein